MIPRAISPRPHTAQMSRTNEIQCWLTAKMKIPVARTKIPNATPPIEMPRIGLPVTKSPPRERVSALNDAFRRLRKAYLPGRPPPRVVPNRRGFIQQATVLNPGAGGGRGGGWLFGGRTLRGRAHPRGGSP